MKTPREVLFKRHEAAETALDVIRKNVVAEHAVIPEKTQLRSHVFSASFIISKLWRELVWPCRRIWVGLAAVWVVILAFGIAGQERGVEVAENPSTAPEVKMALKERRQMLAQLLDPSAQPVVTRPRVPGPRSEQQQTTLIV